MAAYKLANGDVFTDEDIDRISSEFEGETWSGRLDRIHHGSAEISDESLDRPSWRKEVKANRRLSKKKAR